MIVKCGVNGETLSGGRVCVCHHCGMPVCEEHGWVVAADEAFADPATGRSARSDAAARPAGVVPPRALAAPHQAGSVSRPAMHCRDCVEKFHKRAVRRHGWAQPPSTATGRR